MAKACRLTRVSLATTPIQPPYKPTYFRSVTSSSSFLSIMPLSDAKSTPIAFEKSTTRHGRHFKGVNSIGAEFATLGQVRLAAVEDMAHKAVRMEVSDFQDTFFPLPEGVTTDQHPQWPADIFNGLAAGEKLTEQEIQTHFVCFSYCTRSRDAPLNHACR